MGYDCPKCKEDTDIEDFSYDEMYTKINCPKCGCKLKIEFDEYEEYDIEGELTGDWYQEWWLEEDKDPRQIENSAKLDGNTPQTNGEIYACKFKWKDEDEWHNY